MPVDHEVSATRLAPASASGSNLPDWGQIHPPLRAVLPFGEDEAFKTASPTVLRGLFIDLADPGGTGTPLSTLLRRRSDPAGRLEIHADVLRISSPVRLALTSLVIHARRIEIGAAGSLALDAVEGPPAAEVSLDVYAGQIAFERPGATFRIVFLNLPQDFSPADLPGHLRVVRQVDHAGSTSIVSPRPVHELVPGDPLQGQLQLAAAKRLQFAADLPGQPPPWRTGLDLALWVHRTHLLPGGDMGLAAEGGALAERLSSPQRAAHSVPLLRWKVYHELALHQADVLAQVETQAQRFFDRGQLLTAQRDAAQDLLAHYEGASELSRRLCAQAKSELDTAQDAWEASNAQLKTQRTEIGPAKLAFEAGVEKKRTEVQTELALAITGIVLALGAGLIAACMGSGGGADQAANAAKKTEELHGILARLNKAIEMINKVAGFLEKIHKVYELTSKSAAALKQVSKFQGWGKKDVAEQAPTAGDWEAFRAEMEGTFAQPIKMEIDGAQEYLTALLKLSIRARDAIECGVQWTRCQAVHQQRLWEIARDDRDRQTIETRIAALGGGRPDFATRMFYERMHDQLKLSLLQSLDKLGDAYRYYVLSEPAREPSIAMPAAKLRDLVVRAEEDMLRGLESFKTPPAKWRPQAWCLSSLPPRDARAALARLQQQRTFSWTLDPGQLPQIERARIAEIRVWLVGDDLDGREVSIDITTSGVYADRLRGQAFEFITAPLDRGFAYVPKHSGRDRDHRGLHVDITRFADDREGVYAEPTPFTTWEIAIPEATNRGLDLAKVSDIAVEFIGSCLRARAPHRDLLTVAALGPAPVGGPADTAPPLPLALRVL